MENVRLFSQFLQKFIQLSEDEFNHIVRPHLHVRHFKKKQIISAAGEVEQYFNFITKGLVRKYVLKEKDEYHVQISMEGHIIHAHESFYSQHPSEYFIEAIEPTSLVSINYEGLEQIFSSSAKMERMGRLMITFGMIVKERWQLSMIKLTPRERFLYFVEKNPELLQRVPQKYLASFLNIQPETFSRFKHMLKEKI